MTDIRELEEMEAVRQHFENGNGSKLEELLRSSEPLSKATRDYLADWVAGNLKRKRGRKKGSLSHASRAILRQMIQSEKDRLRGDGYDYGDIHGQAMENVSELFADMTPAKLEHAIRLPRK